MLQLWPQGCRRASHRRHRLSERCEKCRSAARRVPENKAAIARAARECHSVRDSRLLDQQIWPQTYNKPTKTFSEHDKTHPNPAKPTQNLLGTSTLELLQAEPAGPLLTPLREQR